MALHYLTGDDGDDIGKGRKKSSGGGGGGGRSGGGKAKRQAKKTQRQAAKPAKKAKRKETRKRVFKKVAKVAVAPARAAFLTAVSLNLTKLATKLVRVWNKPNGKAQITKFWSTFGGDINKLKKAIIKGSKQQISADSLGIVAATVLATAAPIVVALVPILKAFKAAGDKNEAKEFNDDMQQAKKDLRDDPDVEKSSASMPENKDAGIVTDKSGEASEDAKETAKNRAPSESGGSNDDGGGSGSGSAGRSSGGSGSGSGGGSDDDQDEQKKKAEKAMASNFSPLGLFFTTIMYLMLLQPKGMIFELIGFYCFVGMLMIPIATTKNPFQKFAYLIAFTPINIFNLINLKIKSLWRKKIYSIK